MQYLKVTILYIYISIFIIFVFIILKLLSYQQKQPRIYSPISGYTNYLLFIRLRNLPDIGQVKYLIGNVYKACVNRHSLSHRNSRI